MKTSEVKQLRGNKIIVVWDKNGIMRIFSNLKSVCEHLPEISYGTLRNKFQDKNETDYGDYIIKRFVVEN